MMQTNRGDPNDEAALWHARLDSPDMDWDGFAVWFAADAAHRPAYDSIAMVDAQIDEDAPAVAARLTANENVAHVASPRSRRWRWVAAGGAGALAASLVVLVAVPQSHDVPARTITTGSDVSRTLALAEGSTIRIDRHSKLTLSGGTSPVVNLAQGTVSFAVRHDPTRSFVVQAGGYEIRDIGTRFDVSMVSGGVSVAVAQGMVSIAPRDAAAGEETVLAAGQRLDIDTKTATATRSKVAPAWVSAWIDGRLRYDDAPLSLVVADISRYAGLPLVVDPSAADLRFSGVLTIGDGSQLVDQLGLVLPIGKRRLGGVLHLYGSRRR